MRLVVTEFMSLDGVIQDPQNWSFPYWTDAATAFKNEERANASAQLWGRVTYDAFAASWPSRTGDMADRINALPKYVVSSTIQQTDWPGSHIISSDVANRIAQLKQQGSGDLIVDGSPTLVQTLMRHDLVDRYNLLVYPLVLGSGKRLFESGGAAKLSLIDATPLGSGVLALVYEPQRS